MCVVFSYMLCFCRVYKCYIQLFSQTVWLQRCILKRTITTRSKWSENGYSPSELCSGILMFQCQRSLLWWTCTRIFSPSEFNRYMTIVLGLAFFSCFKKYSGWRGILLCKEKHFGGGGRILSLSQLVRYSLGFFRTLWFIRCDRNTCHCFVFLDR
jgi:hypothetical protein